MKLKLLSLTAMLLLTNIVFGQTKYYWVGNDGIWDDTSHWASTSGGNIHFSNPPTINDEVIFDENSFSGENTSYSVSFSDTTHHIACKSMKWQNINNSLSISFNSQSSDTLDIYGDLTMSDNVDFLLTGLLRIYGSTSILNFGKNILNCNIILNSDNISLTSDMLLPKKRLYLQKGSFNFTGYNISCKNFNTDTTAELNLQKTIDVATGTTITGTNNDALTIAGSGSFSNNITFNFDGKIYFNFITDSINYINFYDITLTNDLYFTGNKTMNAMNPIKTNKNIYFSKGFTFNSNNHNIEAKKFIVDNYQKKEINLGNSTITVFGEDKPLQINNYRTTLKSSNSKIIYSYTGDDAININFGDSLFSFNSIQLAATNNYIFSSLNVGQIILPENANLYLGKNITVTTDTLSTNGNCRKYTQIASFCTNEPLAGPFACAGLKPNLNFNKNCDINFVTIQNINSNEKLTANNSQDKGSNIGILFTYPTTNSTLYWVDNTDNDGLWNDANNWSSQSGVTETNACIPNKSDIVIFDENSFSDEGSVYINDIAFCKSMIWTDIDENDILQGSEKLYIYHNIALSSNLQIEIDSSIHWLAGNNPIDTITCNNAKIKTDFIIETSTIKRLNDNFITENNIKVLDIIGAIDNTTQKFDLNKHNLTAKSLLMNGVMDFSDSKIELNGSNEILSLSPEIISTDASEIIISGNNAYSSIIGNVGNTIPKLTISSPSCKTTTDLICKQLTIAEGSNLELMPNKTLEIDTLITDASCGTPIYIGSYKSSNDTTSIKKNGYDSLAINNAIIQNLTAKGAPTIKYIAEKSDSLGVNKGWKFIDNNIGKKFYWLGKTKNWTDTINWGIPPLNKTTSCIPGAKDSVYIYTIGDTIIIDKPAICNSIYWTDNTSPKNRLVFKNSLQVLNAANLVNVNLVYPDGVDATKENSAKLYLSPSFGNSKFFPSKKDYKVNTVISAKSINDTLTIPRDLIMDSLASLTVTSGVFISNNNNISCGFFSAEQNGYPKHINIAASKVNIKYNLFFNDSSLTLTSDQSKLTMLKNKAMSCIFQGGGKTYNVVNFETTPTNFSNLFYKYDISGNNTFNELNIDKDAIIDLSNGSTQTIIDKITINGTCADSVSISATIGATINKSDGCYTDVKNTGFNNISANNLPVKFSYDNGGNSGINFLSSKPIIPSFEIRGNTCSDSIINFINNSTDYNLNSANLTYIWDLGDNNTSTSKNIYHSYKHPLDYIVTLDVRDNNGCKASLTDTITIYKPNISLNTSIIDTVICKDKQIFFNANTTNPEKNFNFYAFNNGTTNLLATGIDTLKMPTLNNNDSIYAVQTYKGCKINSNGFKYTINERPTVAMFFDKTEICKNEKITINGSGAKKYKLYLNNSEYSILDTTKTWTISNIKNADEFVLYGIDTLTGCTDTSNIQAITVNELPTVNIVSDDADLTICGNDTVTFTASNASKYRFYQNGTLLGDYATSPITKIWNIENNNIIQAEGLSDKGCSNMSNAITLTVNPSPIVSFTCNDIDSKICNGESIDFFVGGATEFKFTNNGISSAFSNSNSYTFTSTTPTIYKIEAEGKLGECYSKADTIFTIDVRPNISITNSNTTICAYDSIKLEASGDNKYQFFVDNNPISEMTTNNIFYAKNLTNGQIITVAGTEGACTPDPITVTINETPLVRLFCSEADTAICDGDEITFTANGANTFTFFIDDSKYGTTSSLNLSKISTLTNNQIVTVEGISEKGCKSISTDKYTVKVAPYPSVTLNHTDLDNTICKGDTVTFTANGAEKYEFFHSGNSFGEPNTSATLTTCNLNNNDNIYVIGTSGYCSTKSTENYTFSVNPIPAITLTANTPLSLCKNEEIRLTANGATKYQFYIDDIATGSETTNPIFTSTTITNGQKISVDGTLNSCYSKGDTSFTYTINSYPNLLFTSNKPSGTICFGDTVVFAGKGAQNYTFYLDGVPVSNDSIYTNSELNNNQLVTLHGANGVCGITADTTISLNVNYVNIDLTTESSTAICDGESIDFTANGASLYEFFINGESQGAASTINTFTVSDANNGQIISVNGISENGCIQKAFKDFYLHIKNIPEISFSGTANFCEGDSLMLTSNNLLGNQWYNNNTIIDNAQSPNLWITSSGNYSVSTENGSKNSISSIGNNEYGQLGDATNNNSMQITTAKIDEDVNAVVCGNEFGLALSNSGNVYSWGDNEYGNLGTGNFSSLNTPEQIGNLNNIIKIDAGSRFAMALRNDSTLFTWGENTYGQLGLGNYSTTNFPFSINSLEDVIDIAAGKNHSLALTADGSVWAWGDNSYGQLGDSSLINKNVPVKVHKISNIVKIAAGENHSMAIDNNGKLFVWGANNNGQLGNGTINSAIEPIRPILNKNIISCDGGAAHSVAIDSFGNISSWGDNSFGQLGIENINRSLYPIKTNNTGKIIEIKAAPFATLALRSDSNIVAWGLNTYGQLGTQTTENIFEPTIINQVFNVKSFDGGNKHIAIIQSASASCISESKTITVDTVPEITIIANNYTLTTQTPGISYQWYFNGSAIPNATSNTITISAWGIYYVVIEFENGCYGISDNINFSVGIDEHNNDANIVLYPNPNNGSFAFNINADLATINNIYCWTVYDAYGRKIAENANFSAKLKNNIDLPNIESGLYSLKIVTNNGDTFTKNFVVSK